MADSKKPIWDELGLPRPTLDEPEDDFDVHEDDLANPATAQPAVTRTRESVNKLNPRPADEDEAFDPDDAIRPGNLILAIGKKGSGKTTMQSHLLRYLFKRGDHQTVPDLLPNQDSARFRRALVEWNQHWDNNTFPPGNARGTFTEFRFIAKPRRFKMNALPFGFFEMSGEDFTKLSQPQLPELLPSIDRYLESPQCNFIFLFVCRGDSMEGDDFLFSQFLEYIDRKLDRRQRRSAGVAIVVSDPETSQLLLQQRRKQTQSGGKLDAIGFVDEFVSQTGGLLDDWRDRTVVAPFYIGEVDRSFTPHAIKQPVFDDAKLLYDWMYHMFTGRVLQPDLIARWKIWLEGIG